jgi:hypothetical protein
MATPWVRWKERMYKGNHKELDGKMIYQQINERRKLKRFNMIALHPKILEKNGVKEFNQ